MFGSGGEDWELSAEERLRVATGIAQTKRFDDCNFIYGLGNLPFRVSLSLASELCGIGANSVHYIQSMRILKPAAVYWQYQRLKQIAGLHLFGYFSDNYSRPFQPNEWLDAELPGTLDGLKLSTSNLENLAIALNTYGPSFVIPAKAKQFYMSLQLGARCTTSIEANVSLRELNAVFDNFCINRQDLALKSQEAFDARASRFRSQTGLANFMNITEIKYWLYCNKIIKSSECSPLLLPLTESEKHEIGQI